MNSSLDGDFTHLVTEIAPEMYRFARHPLSEVALSPACGRMAAKQRG